MPKLSWNPPKIKTQESEFEWMVNYAAKVHNGAYETNGQVIYPRPWVNRTLESTNVPNLFKNNFLQLKDFSLAFADTTNDLAKAFTASMEAKQWEYPTNTLRRSGEYVKADELRNIKDLGNLINSLQIRYL